MTLACLGAATQKITYCCGRVMVWSVIYHLALLCPLQSEGHCLARAGLRCGGRLGGAPFQQVMFALVAGLRRGRFECGARLFVTAELVE
jgi:hypothetical protein